MYTKVSTLSLAKLIHLYHTFNRNSIAWATKIKCKLKIMDQKASKCHIKFTIVINRIAIKYSQTKKKKKIARKISNISINRSISVCNEYMRQKMFKTKDNNLINIILICIIWSKLPLYNYRLQSKLYYTVYIILRHIVWLDIVPLALLFWWDIKISLVSASNQGRFGIYIRLVV